MFVHPFARLVANSLNISETAPARDVPIFADSLNLADVFFDQAPFIKVFIAQMLFAQFSRLRLTVFCSYGHW